MGFWPSSEAGLLRELPLDLLYVVLSRYCLFDVSRSSIFRLCRRFAEPAYLAVRDRLVSDFYRVLEEDSLQRYRRLVPPVGNVDVLQVLRMLCLRYGCLLSLSERELAEQVRQPCEASPNDWSYVLYFPEEFFGLPSLSVVSFLLTRVEPLIESFLRVAAPAFLCQRVEGIPAECAIHIFFEYAYVHLAYTYGFGPSIAGSRVADADSVNASFVAYLVLELTGASESVEQVSESLQTVVDYAYMLFIVYAERLAGRDCSYHCFPSTVQQLALWHRYTLRSLCGEMRAPSARTKAVDEKLFLRACFARLPYALHQHMYDGCKLHYIVADYHKLLPLRLARWKVR